LVYYGTQDVAVLRKALVYDIATVCTDLSDDALRKIYEYTMEMRTLDEIAHRQEDAARATNNKLYLLVPKAQQK